MNLTSFGQENEISYLYGELVFMKNSEAYLFGNNVKLRQKPSTESLELENLPILTKLILLEKTKIKQTINGVESSWIKIKAKNKTGYILDNFISSSYLSTNTNIFLTRIIKENDTLFLDMRKIDIKDNDDATQIKLKIPHNNISIKTSKNKGLEGISNIIYINYISEACGMEGGGKYLFIRNGKILKELEINQISDAGIFWKTEKILFPENDKNLEKNSIKFVQEIGNVIDESSQWYEKKIIERQYKFIDNRLVPEFRSKIE